MAQASLFSIFKLFLRVLFLEIKSSVYGKVIWEFFFFSSTKGAWENICGERRSILVSCAGNTRDLFQNLVNCLRRPHRYALKRHFRFFQILMHYCMNPCLEKAIPYCIAMIIILWACVFIHLFFGKVFPACETVAWIFSLLSLHLRERERERDPYLTSAVKSTSFTEVCTTDLLRHSGLNLCVLRVHSHVHQSGNATEQLDEHERKCKETVKTSINQVINEVWRGKKWPINEVSVTKCGMCWKKFRVQFNF